MLPLIKNLLGLAPKTDYKGQLKNGTSIVDVRSKGEYQGGYNDASFNIPLDSLNSNLAKLKNGKTIIICCVSGMRIASAKSILQSKGFSTVHNGGGWMSL